LATEALSAGGALQGASDTEMVGVGISGDVALGDVALDPGFLGAMSPGLPGQYLSGSPGSVSPPINWRHVENKAEFECLQVATAERLLHEAMASVHHNILHPIWVSWEKRLEFCPFSNDFLYVYLFCMCLAPAASIPQKCRCNHVVSSGDPGVRGRC
jgi:hypothetical protein